MVLSGGLSNPHFEDTIHSLIGDAAHQARCRRKKPSAGWPDGRRTFGSVGGAILAVLAQTDSEMRLKDIHVAVERLLGGRVSFQSVADYLLTRSKGLNPVFVR